VFGNGQSAAVANLKNDGRICLNNANAMLLAQVLEGFFNGP
jgi:hypothetical protein